jgi:hypothetical protein
MLGMVTLGIVGIEKIEDLGGTVATRTPGFGATAGGTGARPGAAAGAAACCTGFAAGASSGAAPMAGAWLPRPASL